MKPAPRSKIPGLEPRNCNLTRCSVSTLEISCGYEYEVRGTQKFSGRIRPLGIVESYFATASRFGFYNTVQAAWLSSGKPISVDLVARAVYHVTSNIEVLQTCVWQSSSLRFWLRKMEAYIMDFAVTTQDTVDVFDSLLHTRFDLKGGPLWKVRLAMNPAKNSEAVLLLSVHHCITDGTTNLIILRDIVRALNSLMKEDKCNIEFKPVDPSLADKLLRPCHLPYIIRNGLKEITNVTISLCHLNSFSTLKGHPGQNTGRTRVLTDELSSEVSGKLFETCKKAQVTVNCCILAAARLVVFQLRQIYSQNGRKVKINVENFVNLRRYLRPENSEILGGLISVEEQRFSVSQEDFNDFWGLARKIQRKQTKHLNDEVPVKRQPLFTMMPATEFFNYWLSKKGLKNVEICQLAVTNMGNLEAFFPSKEENPVRVVHYVRSVSDHNGPAMCTLSCQTLQGRLLVSLDHYTNKLTDNMANYFLKTLMGYLRSIAETGDIHSP